MTKDYFKKNGKSLLISAGAFLAFGLGSALGLIQVENPETASLLTALSAFLINFGRLTLGKNGS